MSWYLGWGLEISRKVRKSRETRRWWLKEDVWVGEEKQRELKGGGHG